LSKQTWVSVHELLLTLTVLSHQLNEFVSLQEVSYSKSHFQS
jgi:hypothetical protein